LPHNALAGATCIHFCKSIVNFRHLGSTLPCRRQRHRDFACGSAAVRITCVPIWRVHQQVSHSPPKVSSGSCLVKACMGNSLYQQSSSCQANNEDIGFPLSAILNGRPSGETKICSIGNPAAEAMVALKSCGETAPSNTFMPLSSLLPYT
jgi:hypothetical protein